MAQRIVDHFGQATLEVIEQQPGRLVQVPGLGPKRSGMITAAWVEQQAIKQVMVFLQGVGVSTSLGDDRHPQPPGDRQGDGLQELGDHVLGVTS